MMEVELPVAGSHTVGGLVVGGLVAGCLDSRGRRVLVEDRHWLLYELVDQY